MSTKQRYPLAAAEAVAAKLMGIIYLCAKVSLESRRVQKSPANRAQID